MLTLQQAWSVASWVGQLGRSPVSHHVGATPLEEFHILQRSYLGLLDSCRTSINEKSLFLKISLRNVPFQPRMLPRVAVEYFVSNLMKFGYVEISFRTSIID